MSGAEPVFEDPQGSNGDDGRPSATTLQLVSSVLKSSSSLTVTEVNLSDSFIGDIEAMSLAEILTKNLHLTSLHLAKNNITAIGLRPIIEVVRTKPHFVNLNIACNKVGDVGAEMIARLLRSRDITHLNIGMNEITHEGMKPIAEAIRINRSLALLNVECNELGVEGMSTLIEAVKTSTTITSVRAIGNVKGVENSGLMTQLETICTKNASKKDKKKGKGKK
eukprot:TRINITY_DN1700_c0_g1_i4.p1 TRINITY_DN1700_c0_g1~~TRINITY_DN1700_c0_g1_i4.p1  ORF type:complete len:222 (+),score=60.66 TRINITY_DN1700_c0_g1_i4:74-739(+)